MTDFMAFSPCILIILIFLLQNKFFATPEQLEKMHTEILKEMEKRYLPMFSANEMKEEISEMKSKIDKIYDILIKKWNYFFLKKPEKIPLFSRVSSLFSSSDIFIL